MTGSKIPNVSHRYTHGKELKGFRPSTGQKTGTLKISHQQQKNAIAIALVAECQNLNSGNRLMNGRNSSSCFVGRVGSFEEAPSSSDSS